jgi:hypothetical protein
MISDHDHRNLTIHLYTIGPDSNLASKATPFLPVYLLQDPCARPARAVPNPTFQTTPELQRRTKTSRTQGLTGEEAEEGGLCHEVRLNFVKGLGTVDHASKEINILRCASSVRPMHSTLTL